MDILKYRDDRGPVRTSYMGNSLGSRHRQQGFKTWVTPVRGECAMGWQETRVIEQRFKLVLEVARREEPVIQMPNATAG
jgi:hypothetical protein